MKLSETEIGLRLAPLDQWKREDGKWIVRKYRFTAFMKSMEFANGIAAVAEKMDHHPLLSIDYKLVTVRLTTWKHGGLTDQDFDSAAAYDRIFDQMEL